MKIACVRFESLLNDTLWINFSIEFGFYDQMLDMIHPAVPGKISLNDLKRCQMTPIFFDTFFNLEKYLDHEQRDPFASQRDPDSENGDEILKVIINLK